MTIELENTTPTDVENKSAKKFVKYLFKKQISAEELPIYYNNNNNAIVVLNDKTDSTGYPYTWEIIFNAEQGVTVVKAVKITDNIPGDFSYHILEIINEKNKHILWGKFFLHSNAVFMIAPLNNIDQTLKSSNLLSIIKAMRQSVEEVHNTLLKVFI